ncbi:MAG: DNA repair protein [Rhizobiales bacterium]|nr:DNA repair protein [Hyphomicrobiales bacterium]
MSKPRPTIFTVGHSNHSLETFIAMIGAARVDAVIDVRSFPRSKTNPQFNIDTFAHALSLHQIDYGHWPDLGGRRKRQANVSTDTNGLWNNLSFHNYADYALTTQFQSDLDRLIAFASHRCPALMCSEAVWWRCHRRIITDYLIARDIEVLHIMGEGKISAAKLSPGATVGGDDLVRYPKPIS